MTVRASEKLKIARGTARKDRSAKPAPSACARPEKPDWLGCVASEKWDETVKYLEDEGQLLPAYSDCIVMYCIAHDDFHRYEQVINSEGEFITSEKGGVYQHPAVGARNKAIERIHKFGKALGLTGQSIKTVQKTEKKETVSTKKRFFG